MVFRRNPSLPAFRSRPLRAVALTLLIALVGFAGVGFANEGDAPIPTVIDAFGVPAPRVGDHGLYARLLDPTSGATAELDDDDPYTFTFRWNEDAEMFDRQGRHHWTNVLHTERSWFDHFWQNESMDSHYDQTDRALVAKTWLGDAEHDTDADVFGQRVHGWYGDSTSFALGEHGYWEETVPCGMITPVQGEIHDISTPWRLVHGCTQLGPDPWMPPADYAFVGAVEADGHVYADFAVASFGSVMVDGQEHTFDKRTPHLAELRFRDDLPYPVRMTYVDRSGGSSDNVTIVLRSFEHGDGTPLGRRASEEQGLPTVAFVETPLWGVDDSGFDHPYPLKQAFEEARDHPTDATLRDFLDTHPDAYVAEAWFWEYEGDSEVKREWHIEVSDGVDQVTVCPYQKHLHTGAGGAPREELPLHVPADLIRFSFDCNDDARQDNPDGYVPGPRPSVASMAAVWDQVAPLFGPERAPNEYSFWLWQMPDDEVYTHLSIGIDWIPQSYLQALASAVEENEEHRITWSLDFNEDGTIRSFNTGGYLERRGNGTVLPTGSGDDPSLSTSASMVGPPIRGWEWPSPQEAGLVGAVAATAALLYMLWPWLKALAIPLFSRIDRPRALANAKRADIVAAVEAEPGVHFEELRRRTGIATGALQHHLVKLTETGVLVRREAFGYTGYYPAGTGGAPRDAQAVRSETAREILAAWNADPSVSATELAERLGVSRQAVHYHVKRLKAAGLGP